MANTTVDLKNKVVQEFMASLWGQVPPSWAAPYIQGGTADPALFEAIQKNQPQFVASVVDRVGGTVSGNNLTYKTAADEGDWFQPATMLGSYGIGGAMSGAFSGVNAAAPAASATAAGGNINGMGLTNPWAGATDAAWGVNPRGGGMDFTDFMGADPWGAGAPSAWETLAQAPTGGVNYGGGVDPYGLGWTAPTPTGNAGWDSIFNAGSNLPAGGPWADFAANPYGSGVPSGGMDLSTLGKVAKALGFTNADGSPNVGKLIGTGAGAALGSMNGSKPAGTTTTVQDIPDWLKPYATSLLDQGQAAIEANKVGPDTFTSSDNVLKDAMSGGSIQSQTANPYLGKTVDPTSNPYIGQTTSVGTNMHLGDNNPYFEGILTKALNDTQGRVNNQFGNGNAFGNSANQELLARNLGDQANSLRYGEYDKQTQLSEADVARRLQAQQTDLARNSSLMQNQGQFNAGLQQADLTRNAGLFNIDANRNQNAFQFGKTQQFNAATAMPGYQTNKTSASFAPLTSQKSLFTSGSQTSSPYFSNPAGGALYGGLLGSQLFGGK